MNFNMVFNRWTVQMLELFRKSKELRMMFYALLGFAACRAFWYGLPEVIRALKM